MFVYRKWVLAKSSKRLAKILRSVDLTVVILPHTSAGWLPASVASHRSPFI
jgi:hypothetical protein